MDGAQAPANPWMQDLHDKRLFPLRVIEMDAAGKEQSRMEVTKIEKKGWQNRRIRLAFAE